MAAARTDAFWVVSMTERARLDLRANRRARKYSAKELALRVSWAIVMPAFRYSPRILYGWRSLLLRIMGARVGSAVQVHPSVSIFAPWALEIGDESAIGDRAILYNLAFLRIGRQVTISQGAHLCGGTHDYTRPDFPLVKLPITVEDEAWVCADAFVGPGAVIGEGAVVAARAVVVKEVPAWTVIGGNPAHVIRERHVREPE